MAWLEREFGFGALLEQANLFWSAKFGERPGRGVALSLVLVPRVRTVMGRLQKGSGRGEILSWVGCGVHFGALLRRKNVVRSAKFSGEMVPEVALASGIAPRDRPIMSGSRRGSGWGRRAYWLGQVSGQGHGSIPLGLWKWWRVVSFPVVSRIVGAVF